MLEDLSQITHWVPDIHEGCMVILRLWPRTINVSNGTGRTRSWRRRPSASNFENRAVRNESCCRKGRFQLALPLSLGSYDNVFKCRTAVQTVRSCASSTTSTAYGVSFLSFPTSRSSCASLVGWNSFLYSLLHDLGFHDDAMAPR